MLVLDGADGVLFDQVNKLSLPSVPDIVVVIVFSGSHVGSGWS